MEILLKKSRGVLNYSVLNTNNNIYLHKKQTDYSRNVKTKERKAKEELKQLTNNYKIYCGVEISSARYLIEVKRL